MERYSRQIVLDKIGKEGQEKLLKKRAIVVGLGGTGGLISQLLVRAGIGKLYISDKDYVSLSNIHRQTLFRESDVGKLKVEAALDYLKSLNSDVEIVPIYEGISSSNIEEYVKDVDIVMDGTDNFITRYIINDACVKYNKPWIYSAAISTYGSVMAIIPGKTACLRCMIKDPPQVTETCSTVGVLNSIPSLVASLAVTLAYKILLENYSESVLYYIDGWSMSIDKISVKKNDSCPSCALHNYEFLTEKYARIDNLC